MNLRTGTHQTIKRRLEVLEARQAPVTVYIWREAGESEEAAIKRQSVKPGQDIVVVSWRAEMKKLLLFLEPHPEDISIHPRPFVSD